jgi:hypothetical protein
VRARLHGRVRAVIDLPAILARAAKVPNLSLGARPAARGLAADVRAPLPEAGDKERGNG